MKRKLPETSIEAYHSLNAKQLNDTYKEILSALDVIGEGTFEDIAAYLKEPSAKIWKRLSELNKMELIYRPSNKRKLKSGRMGFTWMKCNPKTTEKESIKTVTQSLEKWFAEHQEEKPLPSFKQLDLL